MPDLRVTDLQKIIRTFADNGHDITQSPRHVHVDGKPYGMVVGHFLRTRPPASNGANASYLESYVMQTERPLVSKITSGQSMPQNHLSNDDYGQIRHPIRDVSAFVRNQHNYGHTTEHAYETLDYENLNYDNSPAENRGWIGDHGEWQDDHDIWHPYAYSRYTDSHAALQSHTSIPHHGITSTHNSTSTSKNGNHSLMTPKEHSSFNEHEALYKLTGVKPFSGLLKVLHNTGEMRIHSYTYNPQTEELHKHE